MMQAGVRQTFSTQEEWAEAWNAPFEPGRKSSGDRSMAEVAHFAGGVMLRQGFRLFHKGVTSVLERRRGPLREEVVFVPAPHAERRPGFPLAVRLHLSHDRIREVRSRYWRPSSRAPIHVATADAGLLEAPPVLSIWHAVRGAATGEAIAETLMTHAVPWFEVFEDPHVLRARLEENQLPLVNFSTSLELVLAEFGEREALRFLRSRIDPYLLNGIVQESVGFETDMDRVMAIAAYYHLR